jgi:nucleoside-diphosphate-sugar epimerase
MSKLITGGTGFLGTQLAHTLVDRGEDIVLFDINVNWDRIKGIKDKVKVIEGNLSVYSEVFNVIRDYHIEAIYHLGSMLSVPSQANPWASFQVNVCGTMNILEAARLFNVEKVIFASSLATYGLGVPEILTDDTLQRPTSMYGCGKVYCELLGRFYKTKFGLDFRTFRSPTLVGPGVRTPGVTQYVSLMIESAALGKPYECYVSKDTKSAGLMYFKDAVRALIMLYEAPREKIITVNYNACGLSKPVTASELEETIRMYIPEVSISYKPDKEIVDYLAKYKDTMQFIDDHKACEEWGWKPLYPNIESIVKDFINEVQTNPEFYGIRS